MSIIDVVAAVAEEDAGVPAASAEVSPTSSAEMLSAGQVLVNRYYAQFSELLEIHRQLVAVKNAIVATPGTQPPETRPTREKRTPMFSALALIADADDAVIAAIKQDLKDIVALF